MSKEEIVLQITLKSIERMATNFSGKTTEVSNKEFSNQVVDFYNNIYKKLNFDENAENNNSYSEPITII